jgi:hypothetical protein
VISYESTNPTTLPGIDSDRLADDLKRALQATMFTSTLRISPRHLQRIAQDLGTAVERFVAGQIGASDMQAYGQHLVAEGLGRQSLLALVQVINRTFWESSDSALQQLAITGSLTHPLLDGYIAGREAHLLREQERTRAALERARTQA